MENLTTDFEQIDQELQELKRRFSRADTVLIELEDIQIQFEGLADTYQKLKEDSIKISRLNAQSDRVLEGIKQIQSDSEKYLAELREKNHLQLDEINSRIVESQMILNTQSSRIDEIESTILASKNSLNAHSSSIQSLQSGIGALTENLAIKKPDLDQIFNEISSLNQEINSIRKNYSQLRKQAKIIKTATAILFGINLFLVVWIWLK